MAAMPARQTRFGSRCTFDPTAVAATGPVAQADSNVLSTPIRAPALPPPRQRPCSLACTRARSRRSHELAGRAGIAGDDYTMADIVAQCACILGKATGVRIPPELTHLSRWFATVSARPTARA